MSKRSKIFKRLAGTQSNGNGGNSGRKPNFRLIVEWFEKRFNRSVWSDYAYFLEWADRFRKGEDFAKSRMDLESLKIWEQIKERGL